LALDRKSRALKKPEEEDENSDESTEI